MLQHRLPALYHGAEDISLSPKLKSGPSLENTAVSTSSRYAMTKRENMFFSFLQSSFSSAIRISVAVLSSLHALSPISYNHPFLSALLRPSIIAQSTDVVMVDGEATELLALQLPDSMTPALSIQRILQSNSEHGKLCRSTLMEVTSSFEPGLAGCSLPVLPPSMVKTRRTA